MTSAKEMKKIADRLQYHKSAILSIELDTDGFPVIVMINGNSQKIIQFSKEFIMFNGAKEAYNKINMLTRKKNFQFPWSAKAYKLIHAGIFEQ
jgi:hypothetical protein